MYTCFVDYAKAFDTVCREALLYKLWNHGIQGRFFRCLDFMYANSSAKVKLIIKLSEKIDILCGTEQGHPTVVLSAGVNDLSCYGLRAHVLADMVVNRLRDTCRKHMKTEFIYNSILHTTHDWLNVEIDIFNKIMYELSFNIPNLLFFDSHGVLQQHPISRSLHNIIDRNDTRGVHITADARRLITENLVSAVEFTINRARGTAMPTRLNNWYWPIRQSFTDRNPSPPHFTHGSHEHHQPHFERETFIPYHRRSVYR